VWHSVRFIPSFLYKGISINDPVIDLKPQILNALVYFRALVMDDFRKCPVRFKYSYNFVVLNVANQELGENRWPTDL
jgi:hypothetical protein